MKKDPDPVIYAHKKATLNTLMELEEEGLIDLFFTDESGFNLTPCVPYGWQPIGEQRRIRSSKTKVTNLFGLLSRMGTLKVYSTPQNINSHMIIDCVDEVASQINRPTVLVFDNAPWHTAKNVMAKQEEWAEKGLFLFFLPTYSPHLNLIETLWRKVKHEWLNPEDYISVEKLKQAVYDIIRKYDDEFCIKFSNKFK